MNDEERSEYLYYIHHWYNNTDPEDVVVSMSDMEKYIMSTFGARLSSLHDPDDPDTRAFYHDYFENEEAVMKFATVKSFGSRTRLSVRRVLGCGHFMLCLHYMAFNMLERKYGEEWRDFGVWQYFKGQLQSSDLLNPEAPCDHASVFKWYQNFYEVLQGQFPEDEFWDNTRIPFTMLSVQGLCERNVDESSPEFITNYAEFLVFHMHGMHELGLLASEPHLNQYLKLLRKRGDPPPEYIQRSQDNYIQIIKTTMTLKKTIRRTVKTTTTLRYRQTEGAGQTRMVGWGSYTRQETSQWHRTENFQATQWRQTTSGLMMKVVNQHWSLGCNGCPTGLQRKTRVTRSGRRRYCKWVTIRRTVLVKRPARRYHRRPIAPGPAAD